MEVPDVRYASDRGASIAYQVIGEGPRDLVFVPGFVSQLEIAWEEPHLARFIRDMSTFARVIWFDKRGTGMSDPLPDEPTPQERMGEILAVMDASSCKKATLFGVSEGASLCMLFASEHPERASGLITFAGFARLIRSEDFPFGWSQRAFDSFLDAFDETFASGSTIEFINPSVAGDERYQAWLARYLRAASSPGRARDLMRANARLDLRPSLSKIDVPTLIMHRLDEPGISAENSRYLSREIPGAMLVELSGVDHWPWLGDADAVIAEIEAFVTGTRRTRSDRPTWGADALTKRERQVAELAAQGLTAREIADRLVISERTVESHIASTYSKLGISSRVELVQQAGHLGL